MVFQTSSTSETIRIGKRLGRFLQPGDVVALVGELGRGKTQFIKGLAEGVGVGRNTYVSSPSFTLINDYQGRIPYYHIDPLKIDLRAVTDVMSSEYAQRRGILPVEVSGRLETSATCEPFVRAWERQLAEMLRPAFRQNPERVWNMLREMDAVVSGARPNPAHTGLGEMEKMGFLHCIITQNVDNLHQAGGAKNVIEYHGNSSTLSCLSCGRTYRAEEKRSEGTPRCECKNILKPDVVFFGEAIPPAALSRSFQLASSAEVLMVVGTSAVVSPANTIPSIAKDRGAKIIEINKERTHLTHTVTDIFIGQSAGEVIPQIVSELKKKKGLSQE